MTSTCAGVFRSLGDGTAGSCSLGRHCDALPLAADPDAYRDAHTRFSDASPPLASASFEDAPSRASRTDEGLLDMISEAMGRLSDINPPRD